MTLEEINMIKNMIDVDWVEQKALDDPNQIYILIQDLLTTVRDLTVTVGLLQESLELAKNLTKGLNTKNKKLLKQINDNDKQ